MPAVTVFKLRDGFRVKGDITVIAQRIEDLKKNHANRKDKAGYVTAEDVLEDARDTSSPLHPCFTWDESEAARQHNLSEARYLIRSYDVVYQPVDKPPILVTPGNVTFTLPETGERAYGGTVRVMSNEETRNEVITEALAMLAGAQKRLAGLQGVSRATLDAIATAIAATEAERTARRKRA